MHFLAALFIVAGFVLLLGAKSAIHEIEAFILWLIAAVLSSSASIVTAMDRIHKEIIGRHDGKQESPPVFLSPATSSNAKTRDVFFVAIIIVLLIAAFTLLWYKDQASPLLREWFGETNRSAPR